MKLNPEHHLLIEVLGQPERLLDLSLAQFNWLLPLARLTGTFSRLATLAVDHDLVEQLPQEIRWHFIGEHRAAESRARHINWELNRLAQALQEFDVPLVLLKGAAYSAAQLAPNRGRISADVDLLVPRHALDRVEQRLLEQGWIAKDLDAPHNAYFRKWLHEIPPIHHHYRRVELDLHHNLLPGTDPLQFDCTPLIERAVPVAPSSPFRMLAPEHMVIHACVHLFRNGDFTHGLRDLVDIHLLLQQFSQANDDFWSRFLDQVNHYRLTEPVWLALSQVQELFGTPLPPSVADSIASWRPASLRRKSFQKLIPRAVFPQTVTRIDSSRQLAIWLMAHHPVPRWRAMLTPLFWLKRLPIHQT